MNVHGTAQEKASFVLSCVEKAKGTAAQKRAKGGIIRITGTLADGTPISMAWDGNGRFLYGPDSRIGERKMRNVAEAERVIADSVPKRTVKGRSLNRR